MRVKCDVNEKGQELLREIFGAELIYPGWNNSEAKVTMLFREMLKPIVIYAALKEAEHVIEVIPKESWQRPHAIVIEVCTLEELQDLRTNLDKQGYDFRTYWRNGTAPGGMMNRHVFSGSIW
jgi:hypothetical protein